MFAINSYIGLIVTFRYTFYDFKNDKFIVLPISWYNYRLYNRIYNFVPIEMLLIKIMISSANNQMITRIFIWCDVELWYQNNKNVFFLDFSVYIWGSWHLVIWNNLIFSYQKILKLESITLIFHISFFPKSNLMVLR